MFILSIMYSMMMDDEMTLHCMHAMYAGSRYDDSPWKKDLTKWEGVIVPDRSPNPKIPPLNPVYSVYPVL